MISAESVKAKLKNQAILNNKLFQEELILYGLERTIYRISISKYSDRFTLKGGIFLYALFDKEFTRNTSDIDLLAELTSNAIGNVEKIFKEIFSIKSDDALNYNIDTLKIKSITEFKAYSGVNVSIIANLKKTQISVSIDIGFGDIIYPERIKMKFPVLLDMDAPEIYVYSLSSVIAEKFEAIVSLGYANSRYKDFYDIYLLINHYNFDGNILKNAIKETFLHRKTEFEDIVIFEEGFAENENRNKSWKAFCKKKKVNTDVSFSLIIEGINEFIEPITNAINSNTDFNKSWNFEETNWLNNI